MDVESYNVLESIKNGLGISGNYISAELVFKTSNILIVFWTLNLISQIWQLINGEYS